jgi:hypothetical protein
MGAKKTHLTTDGGFTSICGRDVRYLLSTNLLEEADCAKCLRISQTAHYWPIFHESKAIHFATGDDQVYCGAVRDIPEPGPVRSTENSLEVTCAACARLMMEDTEVEKDVKSDGCPELTNASPNTVRGLAGLPIYRPQIMPRHAWLEMRLHELVQAIGACQLEQKPVPREWAQEAHHILQELSSE